MEHYLVYPVDTVGRFVSSTSINCETDNEAFRQAAVLIGDYPGVEVWRGTTQIGTFTATEIMRYRRGCRKQAGGGKLTRRGDVAIRS